MAPETTVTQAASSNPPKKRRQGCLSISKALVARVLFALHCLIAAWRVRDIYDDPTYWWLLLALPVLLLEALFIIVKRRGDEFKWFSPVVLIYLLCALPSIWLLELHKLSSLRQGNGTASQNDQASVKLSAVWGLELPVALPSDTWVDALENGLLLVLILGRWLLPKGNVSREQLSLLLLVYVGIASDSLELHQLFREEAILEDGVLRYIILAVWSLSLVQYTLVLTATRQHTPEVADGESPKRSSTFKRRLAQLCTGTDFWGTLLMIILQDGPFLTIRLYCLIMFKLSSYDILFYAVKNILIICLQLYRLLVLLGVICCECKPTERRKNDNDKEQEPGWGLYSYDEEEEEEAEEPEVDYDNSNGNINAGFDMDYFSPSGYSGGYHNRRNIGSAPWVTGGSHSLDRTFFRPAVSASHWTR